MNKKKSLIAVVIPAYNEEKMIATVIRSVRNIGIQTIVVVDDGSKDHTYTKAKGAGAIVLQHSLNRGKGAAVKTGIEATKILRANSVITVDADGQHGSDDIARVLESLQKGNDVVLGYRVRTRQDMPLTRQIANFCANILTWALYGLWVKDSQCGLRAYSMKALSHINTQYDQYEYDSEIIREIYFHKLKYCEIPIQSKYTKYSMHKKDKQNFVNGMKTFIRMAFSI